MPDFRDRSKAALRNLSLAAEWMMRRNVGGDHWWRSTVLTNQNRTDPDKSRPEFDSSTAKEVFDELIKRGLLVERKVDSTGVPAYSMNYDLDGWDKAVSDGRWLRGKWLTITRNWVLVVLTFLGACVVTTIENRVVGLIDGSINAVFPAKAEPEPKPKDDRRVDPTLPEPKEQKGEPNKAVNPSGGSGGN